MRRGGQLVADLPKEVTKDWPNWATLLWNRITQVEDRVSRLQTVILVLGAIITGVLLVTSDASSIAGRLLSLTNLGKP